MNDLGAGVRVGKRFAKLGHRLQQLVGLEDLVRPVDSQCRKRFAVDKLHRNAGASTVLREIVDAHDVVMSQVQVSSRLAFQIVEHGPVVNDQLRKELKRYVALEVLVKRAPDDSHAAAPEDRLKDVALEHLLSGGKATDRLAKVEFVHRLRVLYPIRSQGGANFKDDPSRVRREPRPPVRQPSPAYSIPVLSILRRAAT